MASSIKLKNDLGTEMVITHKDGLPAREVHGSDIVIAVDTIDDMRELANPYDGMPVFVRDTDRGGNFVYDSSKVEDDNDGTNFIGHIRRYSGAVNVKWFGATDSNGDRTKDESIYIQKALDYCFINEKTLYISGNYSIGSTLVLPQSGTSVSNPHLRIVGDFGVINFYDKGHNSSLIAGDALGDNILLDLRFQANIPTRYSISITDLNIHGNVVDNDDTNLTGVGIYISNAYYVFDRVNITRFYYGLISHESYKSSITNSNLSRNGNAINFSSYNSVINMTGNEIRGNNVSDIKLGMSSRVGTDYTSHTYSSINQGSITGNNFEGTPEIILCSDSLNILQGINYAGNYNEGNSTLLNYNTTNNMAVRDSKFTELQYDTVTGMTIFLDYTNNVTITGDVEYIHTTDATDTLKLSLGTHTPNIDFNSNRYLPKYNLNKDYDYTMQQLISTPVTVPKDMFLATGITPTWVTGKNSSKKALSLENTDTVDLNATWKFRVKNVAPFYMDNGKAYDVFCTFSIYSDNDIIVPVSGKNAFDTASTQKFTLSVPTGWSRQSVAISVPTGITATNSTMTINLTIPAGETVILDKTIMAYTLNPVLRKENTGVIDLSIPDDSFTEIGVLGSNKESLDLNLTPTDNYSLWLEPAESAANWEVHQNDSGLTATPQITYTESFRY